MLLVFCSVILPPAHQAICHPFKWVLAHMLNLCTLQLFLPLKFFLKHAFVRHFSMESKLKLFTFLKYMFQVSMRTISQCTFFQRRQENYLCNSLPLLNDFFLGYDQNLISCNILCHNFCCCCFIFVIKNKNNEAQ